MSLCLPAQYQAISGHYIKLSIVRKMDLVKERTQPMAVVPQAKPMTVLPSLYVVPNTHYERTESNHYVCRPNIRLLLAITLKML
jgi:hypothetical protein